MATPPEGRGSDWTGYALVKYGIILIIVIVILYFIVAYVLPIGEDNGNGDGNGVTVPEEPDGGEGEDGANGGEVPTPTTG